MGRRTRYCNEYSAQGDRGDCSFHLHTLPDKVIDKPYFRLINRPDRYFNPRNIWALSLTKKLHPCAHPVGFTLLRTESFSAILFNNIPVISMNLPWFEYSLSQRSVVHRCLSVSLLLLAAHAFA